MSLTLRAICARPYLAAAAGEGHGEADTDSQKSQPALARLAFCLKAGIGYSCFGRHPPQLVTSFLALDNVILTCEAKSIIYLVSLSYEILITCVEVVHSVCGPASRVLPRPGRCRACWRTRLMSSRAAPAAGASTRPLLSSN